MRSEQGGHVLVEIMPGQQRTVYQFPRVVADPQRVPVRQWPGDGQGLEAVHPAPWQESQVVAGQGNSHCPPNHV